MKITIVGCGNVGTQLAVHCAHKKHEVTIFTNKPQIFSSTMKIVDKSGRTTLEGKIALATSDEKQAFAKADLVLVVVPHFLMEAEAKIIEPYANKNMKICLVPGNGGGECAFAKCIEKGATLFALQRVPSVARLVEEGKSVCATGYRSELFVSALPNRYSAECATIIENIMDIKTSIVPCFLNITLTPSNPILHTSRLFVMFKDYKTSKTYEGQAPLFYEDWNDESSKMLFVCDDEVQKLCAKLKPDFDLSYVKSLKEHYESQTIEALTKKIRSIEGFKGLLSPVINTENGYIPDFTSRYFAADFGFGLKIILDIGKLCGFKMPTLTKIMKWYDKLQPNASEFDFTKYGIVDFESFKEFYSQ